MNEYKPIEIRKFPKKSYKNSEMRKFKKYKEDKSIGLNLTCQDIKICKESPNFVASFVFDTIYFYDITKDHMITKYPLSTDVITAGEVRRDGKIIISGLQNGKINVYDSFKKSCLRRYGDHKLQVNSVEISHSMINFVSTSNDMSFKIYDLSRTESILSFDKAHRDYVKCARYVDDSILVTGGYDKTVKLWDIRQNKKGPVQSYDNVNICNDILVMNTLEGKIISSAENYINIFDIRKNELVAQANPIQSGITKLITDRNEMRLFTVSSNETFVKVVELSNLSLKSLYSINLKEQVSSFDISQDMNRYAVSYTNGSIVIKSKNTTEEKEEEELDKDQEEKDIELLDPTKYAKRDVVKNYKYFNRGQYEDNLIEDEVHPTRQRKNKLQDYDIWLKKFQYKNSLSSVIKKKNVELIVSVIEELIDRNTLKLALMNRTEEDLAEILEFILWKIRDPKVMNILTYVFNILIDFYSPVLNKSNRIRTLFERANTEIQKEIDFEQSLIQLNSKLETVHNIKHYISS